jgi:hypothetical protein
MPFEKDLADQVNAYARSDLGGDLSWHVDQFSFLGDDTDLQKRVGEEFFSARYIYKILEGIRLQERWAVSAQARLQVLQYASIYEACLHHILFRRLKDSVEVQRLGIYETLKRYDIPEDKRRLVQHDNRDIVPAFMTEARAAESKIRFDDKVDAAVNLGIIQAGLAGDLKKIYEARNSIHLHAELKKRLEWDIEFGRLAYYRMEPFCVQLATFIGALRDT